MKTVYVFGHKNPDTDSICSAIALAHLKTSLGMKCEPKVIGPINRGTEFVLNYFNVPAPSYLNDVRIQIKDMKYTKKAFVSENDSVENAFNFMRNHDLTAVPLVNDAKVLTGYVSLKDIAKFLIDNDSHHVKSSLKHFVETLKAQILCECMDSFEGDIRTITPTVEEFIKRNDLTSNDILVVGASYKAIEYGIKKCVKLIIITRGRLIPQKLIEKAKKNNVSIISSSYSTFDLCNRLAITNYVKELNNNHNPTTVNVHDYHSDFVTISRKLNYTNYPVVNDKNECLGVIKLTDIGNYERKKVILVDHNNYEQSIDGLSEADILEIFDHHNIGNIGTNLPISFTSRPVGCTATIIYDEYKKNNVEINKSIAGLLLSAIISDTLLFTSPTTTEVDVKAAKALARIAKVDLEKYGMELLKASSSIKGLSVSELIYQDFKTYSINDKNYGIAVITTMDFDEIAKDMDKYIDKLNEMSSGPFAGVLIFICDIIKEGSYVLYNDKSKDLISSAFNIENIEEGYFIKGLMSRKKQILPAIMKELE